MKKNNVWRQRWSISGSDGATWTVSRKDDGTFGCSCPAWKFARFPKPDCKHIAFVKLNPETASSVQAPVKKIVLANVREVTQGDQDELLTPLIPFGDTHFAVTVAYDLARFGAGFQDVSKYLYGNSVSVARAYVVQHGRKIYGPWNADSRRHDGFEIVPVETHIGARHKGKGRPSGVNHVAKNQV